MPYLCAFGSAALWLRICGNDLTDSLEGDATSRKMTDHAKRWSVSQLPSGFAGRVRSGGGDLGFVEAALFEFLAAAAGATVVAAGFGAGAAIGLLRNLCIFVQEFRIFGGGGFGDGLLSGFW